MADPQTQGTATVPPPPSGDPTTDIQGVGNGGGMDRFRSIISRLSGGGTPAIDKALQQHHDQVVADAQRHAASAKQYYGLVARARATGKNPLTGQPVTPEELQKWQQQADGAWADYTKIAGKSKQAKPIIAQMGGLLKHITGGGGQQPPATRGQPTVQPPPQADAAAAKPSPTVPPPPGAGGSNPLQESASQDADREAMAQRSVIEADRGKKEAEESATVTGLDKGLETAGFTPEQRKEILKAKVGGPAMRAALKMHPVMVTDPTDPTRQIPAMQSSIADENGAFPVFGPDGGVIDNPTKMLPAMLPTERQGEMPVFNPVTNQIEQQPTYSKSQKVAPSGGGSKSNGAGGGGSGSGSSKATPSPGSGGRHGIPMRQFGPLQKQATAIDEARNSLIGDDPQKVGGLSADLDVFKSPESIQRISQYLALVNAQVANEAKSISGQGPLVAAEWYVGLPQAVIGLQQGALADASKALRPEEQRFVADYYRALGTIGGMRAATGASSAQWSFNTLRSELPTPGPVTSRSEAARRIHNFIQETNVVAKRNPLLAPAETNRGKTVPPPPDGSGGKTVSLAAAKKLPQNAGKSDDTIKADIKAHGYKVGD